MKSYEQDILPNSSKEISGKLKEILYNLNSKKSPYLVLHSDVLSFRKIEFPIENSIRAFKEYSDETQTTFFFPAFSPSVCLIGKFSAKDTPSTTGLIVEVIRKLPFSVRNNHPIDSYCSFGPQKDIVFKFCDKKLHDQGSACEWFDNNDVHFLSWGSLLSTITQIHYYEFQRDLPYRYKKNFKGVIIEDENEKPYSFDFMVKKKHLTRNTTFDHINELLIKELDYTKFDYCETRFYSVDKTILRDYIYKELDKDPLILLDDKDYFLEQSQKTIISFVGSENYDILSSIYNEIAEKYSPNQFRVYQLPFNTYKQDLLSELPLLFENGVGVAVFCERLEELIDIELTELCKEGWKNKIDYALDLYLSYAKHFIEKCSGKAFVCDFLPIKLNSWNLLLDDEDSTIGPYVAYANSRLREKIEEINNCEVHNFSNSIKSIGVNNAFDLKMYHLGEIPFSLVLSKQFSRDLLGHLLEKSGKTIRAVILDLDNTLWGGNVGEDGVDSLELDHDFPGSSYIDFQKYIKSLKDRGIFLAICSKNTHDKAVEAINKLPNMVLKLDDFSSIRINWDNKSKNISEIANELNLGMKNIAFIDDSVLEREEVKTVLPDIYVTDFPEDIVNLPSLLVNNPYFYCSTVSKDDMKRISRFKSTKHIQENIANSVNLESFYTDLQMRCDLVPINDSNIKRIVTLINKTNQFNTTTNRYSDLVLEKFLKNNGAVYSIFYKDKFVKEGEIIGVVVLKFEDKNTIIDSFLMSCRYLRRTIETKVLADICQIAQDRNCCVVTGLIIKSKRNSLVHDLYKIHKFIEKKPGTFALSLDVEIVHRPAYFL